MVERYITSQRRSILNGSWPMRSLTRCCSIISAPPVPPLPYPFRPLSVVTSTVKVPSFHGSGFQSDLLALYSGDRHRVCYLDVARGPRSRRGSVRRDGPFWACLHNANAGNFELALVFLERQSRQ